MDEKLFKEEQYDVVHVDASTPYDVIVAVSARMAGVKTIVLHSHNNGYQKSVPLRDLFMGVYKKLMPFTVTDYVTISESAAEFMFPKKVVKEKSTDSSVMESGLKIINTMKTTGLPQEKR